MDVLTYCSSFQCSVYHKRKSQFAHRRQSKKSHSLVFSHDALYNFLDDKVILISFDSEFPVVVFPYSVQILLPSIQTLRLKMMNFPLCRRHREKLFNLNSALMFKLLTSNSSH